VSFSNIDYSKEVKFNQIISSLKVKINIKLELQNCMINILYKVYLKL